MKLEGIILGFFCSIVLLLELVNTMSDVLSNLVRTGSLTAEYLHDLIAKKNAPMIRLAWT
jgi:hypothetical protein